MRANRSLKASVNIFKTFLPEEVDRVEISRYLLEMTRHTPRDFLQLFQYLQKFSEGDRLSREQVKAALRDYSIKYFLPEIQDELAGYATTEEISRMVAALSWLRKRDFNMSELVISAGEITKPLSKERVFDILEALFACSGLGNIRHMHMHHGSTTYYSFKFRNRHSTFNEDEQIMLHRGLWRALNVI